MDVPSDLQDKIAELNTSIKELQMIKRIPTFEEVDDLLDTVAMAARDAHFTPSEQGWNVDSETGDEGEMADLCVKARHKLIDSILSCSRPDGDRVPPLFATLKGERGMGDAFGRLIHPERPTEVLKVIYGRKGGVYTDGMGPMEDFMWRLVASASKKLPDPALVSVFLKQVVKHRWMAGDLFIRECLRTYLDEDEPWVVIVDGLAEMNANWQFRSTILGTCTRFVINSRIDEGRHALRCVLVTSVDDETMNPVAVSGKEPIYLRCGPRENYPRLMCGRFL